MVRPKKKPEDRRSANPSMRMTPTEHRLLKKAAEAKGLPLTAWMRETLLRAARRTQKENR